MKLDAGKIALYGGLLVLLSWSIDNMVKKDLDTVSSALDKASAAIESVSQEARLRREILDVQTSVMILQQALLFSHPKQFPATPATQRLMAEETYLSIRTNRIFSIEQQADAIEQILGNVDVESSIWQDFVNAKAQMVNIAHRIRVVRNESLEFGNQALEDSRRSLSPPSAEEQRQVEAQLQSYITRMDPLLEEFVQSRIVETLEVSTRNVLEDVKVCQQDLQRWSSRIKWFYFVLFLIGTLVSIAAQKLQSRQG